MKNVGKSPAAASAGQEVEGPQSRLWADQTVSHAALRILTSPFILVAALVLMLAFSKGKVEVVEVATTALRLFLIIGLARMFLLLKLERHHRQQLRTRMREKDVRAAAAQATKVHDLEAEISTTTGSLLAAFVAVGALALLVH